MKSKVKSQNATVDRWSVGGILSGVLLCLFTVHCLLLTVSAQTSSFTYQGKLTDAGVAANGTYDITFKLYDAFANGTQVGTDIVRDNVVVSEGAFTVDLDFGTAAFASGASRFLQIEVRPGASTGAFTLLVPRQPVTSAPYGIRATNATTADSLSPTCMSCVTDANINTVSATKVTGVLAQANGGTGVTSPGAAGNFLRSDGTNWTSSPFQASDIPVLNNSFIQNIPGIGTQSASFNIDGGGNANIFNATTQYNIGGSRVLSTAGTSNLFAGTNAGLSNTTGFANSFFGAGAGLSNTTGFGNAFVGTGAGQNNTTGNSNSFVGGNAGLLNTTGFDNSFVGRDAGQSNTAGNENSFFGSNAGRGNTTGSSNSFVGTFAGLSNTTGFGNSFVGRSAGQFNTTGDNNSFVGTFAGLSNTTGGDNSFVGYSAGTSNTTGSSNSFVGANAGGANTTGFDNSFVGRDAGASNTDGKENSFLGAFAGNANTTGVFNSFVGKDAGRNNTTGNINSVFGWAVGLSNTTGSENSFFGAAAGALNTSGFGNAFFGKGAGDTNTIGNLNTIIGYRADVNAGDLTYATAIGADSRVFTSNTIALGRDNGSDKVVIYGLGAAGGSTLCQNASLQIAFCSSSLRYKTNIKEFSQGLSFVSKLHPISFDWKDGGTKDVGFGAEDIAKIDPRFVTYNRAGEVEGVKYDRLSVAFVNAFKEQQAEISGQQKQIEDLNSKIKLQQAQIDALKKVVCAQHPTVEICKEER